MRPFNLVLVRHLFRLASLQRWNDQIRPVEFSELDKQAHKMIIAYLLGKCEEEAGRPVNWLALIEGGLFDGLARSLLTDIKPRVYDQMFRDKGPELNAWILDRLGPDFTETPELAERMRCHLATPPFATLEKRILRAAHNLATRWEFEIIHRICPFVYGIDETRREIDAQMEAHAALSGFPRLYPGNRLAHFVDLCGQLRFQKRWSQSPRLPETSVLGHMFFVAMMSYLALLQLGACPKRCYNGFFTALFHDLPEALTRDITSPVKSSVRGLDDLIKGYERTLVRERLLPLLPLAWHQEMLFFIEDEFSNRIDLNGILETTASGEEINRHYNQDVFNPRDGELVRTCDHLAALVEATSSVRHGITSEALEEGIAYLGQRYQGCHTAGLDFGAVFQELLIEAQAAKRPLP